MKLAIFLDTSKVPYDDQGTMVASVLRDLAREFETNAHFNSINHDERGNWGACPLKHNGKDVGGMELLNGDTTNRVELHRHIVELLKTHLRLHDFLLPMTPVVNGQERWTDDDLNDLRDEASEVIDILEERTP